MNRQAAWTAKIFDLLSSGPLPLEKVIAEVRFTVPPGRAIRAAEKKRERMRERMPRKTDRRYPERTEGHSDDDSIRVGQRQVVMQSVNLLIKSGRLQYEDHDGVRWIALGREVIKDSGLANPDHPVRQLLAAHEPTFIKRKLDGIAYTGNKAVYAIDIECSCGWTWTGASRNEDGLWEVWTTSKQEAQKVVTKHRRGDTFNPHSLGYV